MYTPRLRFRVRSARPIGVAKLEGFQLQWNKRSKDGSGKCGILAASNSGATVIGVIFQIDPSEKKLLDRAEGVGAGYFELPIAPTMNEAEVAAFTYIPDQAFRKDGLAVYGWYKDFVIAGAREHCLPENYIAISELG